MKRFIEGDDRTQSTLFPATLADFIAEDNPVRVIDAFVDALSRETGLDIKVYSYSEHSVGGGANANAIAFVEAEVDGKRLYGVGKSANIVSASLIAVTCAVNRVLRGPR